MRLSKRMTMLCLPCLLLMLPFAASAQWQKKPYSEWSEKEVTNVLNSSPWAQTQTIVESSKMPEISSAAGRSQNTNGSIPDRMSESSRVHYRVRFFSAKPIRQATSRMFEIQQKGQVNEQLTTQLQALVNAEFRDYVVLTLVIDTKEARTQTGPLKVMLDKQLTADLKSETYLLVKGGQKVFLHEYQVPRPDGFGARFIFPRNPDGKPLLSPDSTEVLFHAKLSGGPTLNLRFKVKEMIWEEKLDY